MIYKLGLSKPRYLLRPLRRWGSPGGSSHEKIHMLKQAVRPELTALYRDFRRRGIVPEAGCLAMGGGSILFPAQMCVGTASPIGGVLQVGIAQDNSKMASRWCYK